MHLGEKLRSLRKDKEWTQPQLAEAIGIEQSYLSKLENGKSVPSADIFELILKTFEIDTGELLEDIDESVIFRQLRQIPEVSNYLSARQSINSKSKKRWLMGSSLSLILGLVFIISSIFGLLFPTQQYNYFSHGVVLEGESKEIFSNFHRGYTHDRELMQKRTLEFNQRLSEKYLLSDTYRGNTFSYPVEGGSRTYELKGDLNVVRVENRYISVVGLFLLLVGIFGFILEKRMTRIE